MNKLFFLAVVFLSGCSLLHGRKPLAPATPELVVTGAPLGSLIFVDGIQVGAATETNDQSREIDVSPGDHTVEIHMGTVVVYREQTYVDRGAKRAVTVLSGFQTPAGFQPMAVPQ